MNEFNTKSLRSKKARTAAVIGDLKYRVVILVAATAGVLAVVFLIGKAGTRPTFLSLFVCLLAIIFCAWYKLDLTNNPPSAEAKSLDEELESGLLGVFIKEGPITPGLAWAAACSQWHGQFLIHHLLLDREQMSRLISKDQIDMPTVWNKARELAWRSGTKEINGGSLTAALLINSNFTTMFLSSVNLSSEDVMEVYAWLQRLDDYLVQPRPYFGGIGRDWAAGFTPALNNFGENISRAVESRRAGHYHTLAHSDILDSLVHNLGQGGGVALVGDAGTGKTSLTYALAQRLLEGRDEKLRHYQIVSLNASQILAVSRDKLENIVLTLLAESAHARNIIIFLDEARLFFGQGAGAFDMGQILMPLFQNRSIKIISAFTPHDFQLLKATNESLAANFAVINIAEPPDNIVMDILEDKALSLEMNNHLLVSFQALREAYRLSTQYFQDQAFPGKAINLIEQSVPYSQNNIMTASSVQSTIEKISGIKVSKANAPEADMLLHLEDRIHERMINQTRAVTAVASALRRGRAGVGSPNRPVGTFLFLGPTGVGKTELARSLAAAYFGDEHRMIRLDMSEFQQPEDTTRLLESSRQSGQTLLMSIRQQPFSVVLLDEVEKAHPNILNLLLQLLDEGQLTDNNGKSASFKSAIIICTSNAGSAEISERATSDQSLDNFERPLIEKLISQGVFRPELINRFDDVVLFRPLREDELAQVALLMLSELNRNLSKQNLTVQLTQQALIKVVHEGYDPQFGARHMRRTVQKLVEDAVASRILKGQAQPGTKILLDIKDLFSGGQ